MVSIPMWEDEYRKLFLVNGVSILEVLSETINASNEGKENRKVIFVVVTLSPVLDFYCALACYSELELARYLPVGQPPNQASTVRVPQPLHSTPKTLGTRSQCRASDHASAIPTC